MIIYPNESSLKDLILSATRSKTCAAVKSKKSVAAASVVAENNEEEKSHPAIMSCSAILCSTVMNLNDDVFLPYETWAARASVKNQPFNSEHEREKIIGHITSYFVLDKNGDKVEDSDTSGYPEYFDLAVNFVMYKDIFPDMAEEIVDRALANQAFVSMECAFDNFDYALVDGASIKIIKRNTDTAFLTKYLSAYGGTGKYGEFKIGRVLRDIVFCGMGDVTDPANPASKYLKIENYSYAKINEIKKGENMATEPTFTQAQVDEQIKTAVEAALAGVKEANEKLITEAKAASDQVVAGLQTELETSKAEVTKTKDELSAAASKLDISQGELTKAQASLEAVNKELETTKTTLAAKTAELDTISAEKKVQARFKSLADAGIVLDDTKEAKIPTMSDESFASVLEFASKISNQNTEDEATKKAAAEKALKDAEALKTEADKKLEGAGEGVADVEAKITETATKLVTAMRKSKKNKK